MLESLGVVSILMSWLAGIYLLTTWRGNRRMSISQHAASAKRAYLLFAWTLTISGTLLYIFIIRWFMPHLGLGLGFGLLFSLAYALELIAAWVPETTGWQSKVHTYAAYIMAFLFMPLAVYIIFLGQISFTARFIDSVCLAYMVIAWGLFLLSNNARERYLIYQTLYILSVQFVLLSSSYIK